ncbi:MAG: 2-succinyl-5-enolpyruvyl-6-hydroxy-3-cyclohexene-1-carboxylic-acid synthase [Calditrichaeota bacterium]|nr:MAG: 2-succinyl-5-enolpyruvyl-6-hydroxy-3-cyclohexene-1-carboxylic-acid synthase [Calditrichota bacterium]
MIRSSANLNALWCNLLVEELVRNGVDQFCISPGSRSTPLTLAAANNKWAKTSLFYDERAAAYFATGFARATGKPAVLICTSGTAVANFLPAVVEAAAANIPLIILSADRPAELRDTGANQTISQPNIYGDYIRWHFDLPCPTLEITPQFVLTTIDQAIYQATRNPAGPVHLNCMFREPLAPLENDTVNRVDFAGLEKWLDATSPFTSYVPGECKMSPDSVKKAAISINSSISGLVILGEMRSEKDQQSAVKFCRELNWPVALDIQSGLRLQNLDEPFLPFFDQLLYSEEFIGNFKPDTVIQLGDRLVSKKLAQFIAHADLENYILVANHPFRRDENHKISLRFELPVAVFCESLQSHLIFSQPPEKINAAHSLTASHLTSYFEKMVELNELFLARTLSEIIPENSGLFLGNSMPIRDMNTVAGLPGKNIKIAANRGASGIDGNLATAVGFAAGLHTPVTVLIGDLATLHDLNSFYLLSQTHEQIITIISNNHGGGIFNFLPVAQTTEHFEPFFGTPHSLNFQRAAQMFSLDYKCVTTHDAFVESYQLFVASTKSAIIEVETSRDKNWQLHRKLQKQVAASVDKFFQD